MGPKFPQTATAMLCSVFAASSAMCGDSRVWTAGSLALFGLGGLLYARLARTPLTTLGQLKLAALGSALLALSFVTFAVLPAASWSLAACFGAGVGFYNLHNTLQTCAAQLNTAARCSAVSLFVFLFFLGQSVGVSQGGNGREAGLVARVSCRCCNLNSLKRSALFSQTCNPSSKELV